VGDEAKLVELLQGFGVSLRTEGDRLEGSCQRCGERLAVEEARWRCGCGFGGPVELVAVFGGFSMSHATELVRSGWRPSGVGGVVTKSSLRPLPLLCDPDADDESLIDAVLAHYQGERRASELARGWLAGLGVGDELADELRIGVSNRTLGYRLPEGNRKDGARLRERLISLGLYRPSGHEHFRGCVVVPVLSAQGHVLQLCGIRLAEPSAEAQWATGLPGGLFNEAAVTNGGTVVVVGSVADALAARGAGEAAVVAPGRHGGYLAADLRLLARGGVRRCVVVGDGLGSAAERLSAEGIECAVVSPGAPLAHVLGSASDRAAALGALVESARALTTFTECARSPGGRDVAAADTTDADDTGPQVSGDAAELHVAFGPRRWRVRGAERNKSPDTLRVSLAVTDERSGGFHLDTLDLCQAKARGAFVDAAVAELHTDRPGLVRELAEVIFATEAAVAARDAAGAAPEMSDAGREEALALLGDPELEPIRWSSISVRSGSWARRPTFSSPTWPPSRAWPSGPSAWWSSPPPRRASRRWQTRCANSCPKKIWPAIRQ